MYVCAVFVYAYANVHLCVFKYMYMCLVLMCGHQRVISSHYSALWFYHVYLSDPVQADWLGDKLLYLLSHLFGPSV